ncbi:MAG: NHL repeat-containing protein, partial [Thaumarchaeota archaeon]|nr:NHL repeat-containing protein [Nitrososphaerota archaeon]
MGHALPAAMAIAALAAALAAPAMAEGPAHEFVTSWGSLGASGEGRFSGPTSLAVDHVGSVYVADTGNARIQKFNNLGGFEALWDGLGNSTESLSSPMGVAVMDGRVYVVDSVLESVIVYGLDGEYLSRWGGHGGDPGEFLQPRGVAARNGTVYVADTGNSRVQAFTPSGTHLLTFGTDRNEAARLRSPVGIAVAPDSSVFVMDPGTMTMLHYGANGTLIGHFDGTVAGKSLRPRGVAVDGEGKVYVADTRNDRILRLEPGGMTLSAWGDAGNGAYKYLMPTDVAIDLYGQLFVVDSGGHSIKKYTTPLALADSERADARAAAEERFRASQEAPP